jgi:hypothetical protein
MAFVDSLGWLPLAVIICTLTSHALGCLPVLVTILRISFGRKVFGKTLKPKNN